MDKNEKFMKSLLEKTSNIVAKNFRFGDSPEDASFNEGLGKGMELGMEIVAETIQELVDEDRELKFGDSFEQLIKELEKE